MPVTSATSNSDVSSTSQSSNTVPMAERDKFLESVLNMAKAVYEAVSKGDSASVNAICGSFSLLLNEANPFKRAALTSRSAEAPNAAMFNSAETGIVGTHSVKAEAMKVNSDIDALKLPADFAEKFKKCVRLVASQLEAEKDAKPGHIGFELKSRALNLLIDESFDDENAKDWLAKIKNSLPDESLTAVSDIKAEIVRIRAEGLFSLLSATLFTPPIEGEQAAVQGENASMFKTLDNNQAFNQKLRTIRNDTKLLVKRGLPTDLAVALRLDELFDSRCPLSKVGLVLTTRLTYEGGPDAIKNHITEVKSISDAIGNSPSIPNSLFDANILNRAIADKALDLAFHQKTRANAPEVYEKALSKISEQALHKAMVGRIGRDIGLDANRTNAIKNFISALQFKGASATGDTSAAIQTLKQAIEIFGPSGVASYAKWGMGQSQRRNAIANSVVGYVQYLTGSSNDASGLIKEMIKKPASGQSRPGSGELTAVAKEQLNKLGHSLVQLVDPERNVHRKSELEGAFRKLVEGSLVASGIDSHSVQRAREPGKQVQKPIVVTARPMAVKEDEKPATNKGILNTITRIGLPVMRDDTAGRSLKIQRTLQANIAKSLMFNGNVLNLNRINKMIQESTSCAQLYQIGLLVAVAAGERRLATRAGAALLEKSFDLEKRAAVGAKAEDKQILRDSVRALMTEGATSLPADLHAELNRQVVATGAYSVNGVAEQEKNTGKVGPFTLRRTVRKEAQNSILNPQPPAADGEEIPAREPRRQESRFVGMNRFSRLMGEALGQVSAGPLFRDTLTAAQQNTLTTQLSGRLVAMANAERINFSTLNEEDLSVRLNNLLNELLPDSDELTRTGLSVQLMDAFQELNHPVA